MELNSGAELSDTAARADLDSRRGDACSTSAKYSYADMDKRCRIALCLLAGTHPQWEIRLSEP